MAAKTTSWNLLQPSRPKTLTSTVSSLSSRKRYRDGSPTGAWCPLDAQVLLWRERGIAVTRAQLWWQWSRCNPSKMVMYPTCLSTMVNKRRPLPSSKPISFQLLCLTIFEKMAFSFNNPQRPQVVEALQRLQHWHLKIKASIVPQVSRGSPSRRQSKRPGSCRPLEVLLYSAF